MPDGLRVEFVYMASACVLVVDDNPLFRATAMDILRDLGLRVFEAYKGDFALSLIEAHPEIRLIFIDVRMPGMSGPDLAEQVRRRYPAIKIVMTSGFVGEECCPKGFPFLAKPWRPNEVASTVKLQAA